MKYLVLLFIFGIANAKYTTFTWKSCTTDMPHRALKVDSVSIRPMPVITPGDMHISFQAEVLKKIDLAILEFNLTRHTSFGVGVHIPCTGTLGSCPLDGCSIVDDLVNGTREAQRDLGRQIKKMFESVGIFSSCPIAVQNVTVTDYVFKLPELGAAVSFIGDGDYTVVVRVKDPTTLDELGCFEFNATLQRKKPQHSGFIFGTGRK